MVRDVDDPANYERHLQGQLDDLDRVPDDRDRDAILRWITGMDKAVTTRVGRANCVKLLAVRADRPLHDFESEHDVLTLLAKFQTGRHPAVPDDGLASGTVREYRQAARLFFRDALGREWGGAIEVGAVEQPSIRPEQVITSEEADALLDACTHPRDRALLAFLLALGQRITATLSLRRGAVDLARSHGRIRLNGAATGLKGASGPRPLLWARPYVATWLQHHPVAEDAAPLFCTTQAGSRTMPDGEVIEWDVGAPLSRSQTRNRLRKWANRADVPASKVTPHNFRHTCITRLRGQDVDDDRIKFLVGVAPDSDILERYDQADTEEMIRRLRDAHGIDVDDGDVGRPTVEQCPQCATPMRGSEAFCPQCAAPVTAAAAEARDESTERIADSIANANGDTQRALAREALSDLLDDPDILDAVVERIGEAHTALSESTGERSP